MTTALARSVRAALVTLAALATTVAVAGSTAQAATTPKLRLVDQQPLVVRGEAFRPGERMSVATIARRYRDIAAHTVGASPDIVARTREPAKRR